MNKLFYGKLAAQNLKKNRQFYFPYILTVVGSAAAFYILAALANTRPVSTKVRYYYLSVYMLLGMVVVGSGWSAKGFGKVTAIFGSVYNHVTGYFGDILSYSRLMTLMLAGSVIASVFNTLGAIPGNVVIFLIISALGNGLNFALNLLSCYVHDLRLQCLEYFGKFYQDGGKPFEPLAINTKYVDIQS